MSRYASIEFDPADYIHQISTKELERALKSRIRPSLDEVPPMEVAEINFFLDEAAFELRKVGKLNLAFRLDEVRHEHFSPLAKE